MQADGPIHNFIHHRSKLRSKSEKFFDSLDIPVWPLVTLAVLPFMILPGLASRPTITEPDPDCACSSRRDGSRRLETNLRSRDLQILEDFDDDDIPNDDWAPINNFLPQSPSGYTEQFCFCHCYCEEFKLVSIFRNDTNGEWSNNNITDKPDFINPLVPTCGCVDPVPYLISPEANEIPISENVPSASPSYESNLALDISVVVEDPVDGIISVPPPP